MELLNTIIHTAAHGLDAPDAALATVRIATGVFFGISGYHKLFNKERHAKLTNTLVADKIPAVPFMQWWVPGWEFASGIMLTLGLFSAFNAVVLAIICAVACGAEAGKRIAAYHPIDKADYVDDALYLQEVLYILMLAVTVFAGPGAFSLDHLFF